LPTAAGDEDDARGDDRNELAAGERQAVERDGSGSGRRQRVSRQTARVSAEAGDERHVQLARTIDGDTVVLAGETLARSLSPSSAGKRAVEGGSAASGWARARG
jgi:hypothetical protein